MNQLSHVKRNPDDWQLIEKLKGVRSMKERLIILLKLYPNSIQGLEISCLIDINAKPRSNGAGEEISLGHTDKKGSLGIQKETNLPTEVILKRKFIRIFAKLTTTSTRSFERGLSSFFLRNFNLINITPYSRFQITFGKKRKSQPKKVLKFPLKKPKKSNQKSKLVVDSKFHFPNMQKSNCQTKTVFTQKTNKKNQISLRKRQISYLEREDWKKKINLYLHIRIFYYCAKFLVNIEIILFQDQIPLNICKDKHLYEILFETSVLYINFEM